MVDHVQVRMADSPDVEVLVQFNCAMAKASIQHKLDLYSLLCLRAELSINVRAGKQETEGLNLDVDTLKVSERYYSSFCRCTLPGQETAGWPCCRLVFAMLFVTPPTGHTLLLRYWVVSLRQ